MCFAFVMKMEAQTPACSFGTANSRVMVFSRKLVAGSFFALK